MLRPIRNNSKKNDLVVDPFLGSGTTLIAAEQLDRICYGVEIDPVYTDVVCQRWQQFVGDGKAVLEATGQTFDEVKKERLGNAKG